MNGVNKGSLETVVNCLQREASITIIGHSIPDGDCIGSCLGMAMALEGMGKSVRVVLTDPIPTTYKYLEGQHLLTTPEAILDTGVLLYLDCADQERTGALPPAFVERAKVVVNIDHHVSNNCFGDYYWVAPTAAATCEICLQVLDAMGTKPSPAVASALYTGILMDSGSFLYTSTTPQTLRVAARLLEYGAAKDIIREALFETKSLLEMQVLRLTLQNLRVN
ncbi:MAG: DHH family phosphoesterase, partial [Methylocystaceae bacterium]